MHDKTRRLTYLTLFITIEVVISIVPFLGFIPLGFINATTLHIPVILAGILLSKRDGAIVGFVFGLLSFLKSTFEPNMTSFLFSPFFSMGGIQGNFTSLIIAFLPRILVGYMSGLIYEIASRHLKEAMSVSISAFIASFIFNTGLVMSLAYIFFRDAYALSQGLAQSAVLTAIVTVIFTSGIIEAIIAMIITLAIYKAAKKIMKGAPNV